ncbi:MAG: metallophosphoesterase [Phycisphaerae bacterium]|jgi:hypothetical protein|nr:metallophosphoesterase [Phycisphaerae bacterium]NUQ50440.1 metallophosphoesterase [Phycisphaerae bacterium]
MRGAADQRGAPSYVRRMRVLLGAAAFVLAGLGLYQVSPWLLPLAVAEGPMVQQAGPHSVRIVWYLSRPDESGFRLKDAVASVTTLQQGRRWSARVEGLEPGREYAYEILDGDQVIATHAFRTERPVQEPFSFVVFGDSGKGTKAQFQVAAQMAALAPDFMVHTGDVVYPDGSRGRYRKRFFDPYRELLPSVAFWPCLGNHDVSLPGAEAYHEIFELPENGPPDQPAEQNYWFDYGQARFVVLNSNLPEAELSASVAPWLAQALKGAPPWRFAVFHHPPYTAGSHKPSGALQRVIVPVLEAGGIDIVFNGHDHMYQRTEPLLAGQPAAAASADDAAALVAPGSDGATVRGIVYIVSGAGGARLYDLAPADRRPAYFAALDNSVHSFTHVRIDGSTLHLRQIAADGRVLDEWSLTKTPTEAGH